MLKVYYFFQLPKLKKMLFGGGGGRSGEVAPAYQVIKRLKIDFVALHAVSDSKPQRLQNVIKKQRRNAGYWNSEYMYSIKQ